MTRLLVLRVYKALLDISRPIRDLGPSKFQLREPVKDAVWGTYSVTSTGLAYQTELLQRLLPGLAVLPTAPLDAAVFKACIRDNFAARKAESSQEQITQHIDTAFQALRLASQQLHLTSCSSSTTTDGVTIDTVSGYDGAEPGMTGDLLYGFTYQIRITNHRQQHIKVMGRTWTVLNSGQEVVHSIPLADNSVVGQQPIIPPGQCFQYHSGINLKVTSGTLVGAIKVLVLGKGVSEAATMQIVAGVAPLKLAVPAAAQEAAAAQRSSADDDLL